MKRAHKGRCPARGRDDRGGCLGVCTECGSHLVETPAVPVPHCEFCEVCWWCGRQGEHAARCRLDGKPGNGKAAGVGYDVLVARCSARMRGRRVHKAEPQEVTP